MRKTVVWALAALASAAAIAADLPSYLEGDWGVTANTIVGPIFAVAGALAATRRPDNAIGIWLLLTALAWPIGSLPKYPSVPTILIAISGGWLWVIPLTYVVLAFPTGKLERRKDALLCWLMTLPTFWLILPLLPLTRITDPASQKNFYPSSAKPIVDALDLVGITLAVVCVGLLIARVREKWLRATPAGRRALAPVAITGSVSLATTALLVLGVMYVPALKELGTVLGRINWLVVAAVPIAFLVGLSRARARRARVGELVVELGELPSPERLQHALRKALGDPTLVAAFWLPDAQRYLTAEGRTLTLPEEGAPSVATFLERDGEPLAVIVHDRVLLEDPGLVAAATAATRLAVENERLQQEVVEQLMEVRASRGRIIQAGDEARRRLERDLHDGAQQRLVTLGLQLQRLSTKLGPLDEEGAQVMEEARTELRGALTELRDLARGLHPLVLTEEGLGAAIETLRARFPLPIRLEMNELGRLPEAIETAAYFAVSEALTNVAKHAHATAVDLSVSMRDEVVIFAISDDGIGGASMAAGSGLRGLADRIQALDGSFAMSSPVGGGTRITFSLPASGAELEDIGTSLALKESLLAARRGPVERTLLEVRGLDVFYGQHQVLFGVDIDVESRQVVALLGTNGAGKSTLVRTLAGLHDHLRGSIRFKDQEFTDLPPERRSRSGCVFVEGGAAVFEPLTVDENLKLFARHAGVSADEARTRAFDTFPLLAARRYQRASSLSRGEQHMLGLARAVMHDASLVIVDELTLGLAPDAADEVCEHLRQLNDGGTAILFVEQSITVAARLADLAYFLDGGRIAFAGTPGELEATGLLSPLWIHREDFADV